MFIYDEGTINVTIRSETRLFYRLDELRDDNGTSDFSYSAADNTSTFVTSNLDSFFAGPLGTNTWTMTWTSATGGTATDAAASFTPPAINFEFSEATPTTAPSDLLSGQDILLEPLSGSECPHWFEAYDDGTMLVLGFRDCLPSGSATTGPYTWTPSASTATLSAPDITVELTFETGRSGTYTSADHEGNFGLLPVPRNP